MKNALEIGRFSIAILFQTTQVILSEPVGFLKPERALKTLLPRQKER